MATNTKVIELFVGAVEYLNMNFASRLAAQDLSGTPTITANDSTITIDQKTASGKKAQGRFTGTTPGDYLIKFSCDDDSSPAQTVREKATLRIKSF